MASPQLTSSTSNPGQSSSGIKNETVWFLQLVCIFTDLVPKILLDVFKHHITLNKAFQKRFGKKPWDGSFEHRQWLASIMKKNTRIQDVSCTVVKTKRDTEWDVTNLSAALSAVMEPSDVPCDVAVTQARSRTGRPLAYFDVSMSEGSCCKTWEGFSINVTGASPDEVVECVVTEAPSDTQVVAVSRERVKDRDFPKKITKYMATESRPIYLPRSEVSDIVKVRQSRNTLYHRSTTEVSESEFTQCVTSVRSLIEQAVCPYLPKGDSECYLAKLDEAAFADFRKSICDDRPILEMVLNRLKHLEEELGGVGELCQEMDKTTGELLRKIKLLETELTKQMSCLERKVYDLQCERDSQKAAIQDLQSEQGVLCQRMDSVDMQSRVTVAQQSNGGDPLPSLPHVLDSEVCPQVAFLKERVYDEYQRFKLGEGPNQNAEYVNLAVLTRPPSTKLQDVKDKMEVIRRYTDCGVRVADESTPHITPVDLLKKGSERIQVVYGQAGSGKTTLLKHMCRVLSCGEVDSDFDLVLYFPLREKCVSSASDFKSLLCYYMQDEDPADVYSIAKLLKGSKGRGLLMLFDGADEVKDLLKPSSGSVIRGILEGRILSEAHVIISSRPGVSSSLQDHSACFYEVQGFDRTAITSYVKGFFKLSPAAADRMLSQLETRPDLMRGAYIPMNSFILCSIFDPKSATFPATMTNCYQAFVRQTIYRECNKKERDLHLDQYLQHAHLPEDIRCLFASLGALSFQGLCQVPPMFIFDEYGSSPSEPSIRSTFSQDLLPPSAAIDDYLFKGLLHMHTSRRGFESLHSFSFPHGTQQEFFAALHLSQLEEDKQAQFWKENLFNVFFSVVLRFHAGLTRLSSLQVAKEICSTLSGAGEGSSSSHLMGECSYGNPELLFLCHTLYESQNIHLTKKVMQHIPSSLRFSLNLSAFDTMAIAHCLSQCSHLKLLKMPLYSCTLLSAQCLSHLMAVRQANPDCQLDDSLRLCCDNFSADDAKTLSRVARSLESLHLTMSHTDCTALSTVCSLPCVKSLEIAVHNDVKDDNGWPLVESSLAQNKQLESLILRGCDAFLLNLGKVLTKNTSIKTLDLLREHPIPDNVACALGTCVAAMTQLRELYMFHLPLPVLKVLAERTEPLENLTVLPHPGVNWDGFSEEEWEEATEAVATARMREVELKFDCKSRQSSRAIDVICNGLAQNNFIGCISLRGVPEEIKISAEDKLLSNSSVTVVDVR